MRLEPGACGNRHKHGTPPPPGAATQPLPGATRTHLDVFVGAAAREQRAVTGDGEACDWQLVAIKAEEKFERVGVEDLCGGVGRSVRGEAPSFSGAEQSALPQTPTSPSPPPFRVRPCPKSAPRKQPTLTTRNPSHTTTLMALNSPPPHTHSSHAITLMVASSSATASRRPSGVTAKESTSSAISRLRTAWMPSCLRLPVGWRQSGACEIRRQSLGRK